MKIATWNVERLKHKDKVNQIIAECEKIKADILVLTETESRIHPDYQNCFQTPLPANMQSSIYMSTENRVSIFTNYPCICQHQTYDINTSICVELDTEYGNLLVYGTIIGIFGNRHRSFQLDLEKQTADFRRLVADGRNLCVCGDYNLSFSDNFYFTTSGRLGIIKSFEENNIRLLTSEQSECIDHVAISTDFVGNSRIHIEEWNLDKKLSDHKGISVELFS